MFGIEFDFISDYGITHKKAIAYIEPVYQIYSDVMNVSILVYHNVDTYKSNKKPVGHKLVKIPYQQGDGQPEMLEKLAQELNGQIVELPERDTQNGLP